MGECSDASVSEQNRDDSYWNEGKIGQGRHVSARLVLHRSCVLVSPTHEVEKRDDEPDEDGNPKENLFSSRGKERRYRGSGHLRAPQRLLTHARLPPGWPRGCGDSRPAFVGGGARREARTTHGTRGQCATRCAAPGTAEVGSWLDTHRLLPARALRERFPGDASPCGIRIRRDARGAWRGK